MPLADAGLEEWIQHLTNIRGRWLAAHVGGVALFPLIGMTIWWMLPARGVVSSISKIALVVYVPLYIAVDAVLGIGSSILISYRKGLAPAERAAGLALGIAVSQYLILERRVFMAGRPLIESSLGATAPRG